MSPSNLYPRGFICLAMLVGCLSCLSGKTSLPNIVVILSDDYGYGSVGCYGADETVVTTPSIDRLAREGMRFTDANTPSSVCTPTRYALLTGRYCWRSPLNDGKVVWTMDPLLIEPERPTVASLLKAKGYDTGFIGKWHLGYGTAPEVDYRSELKPGPLELGFDYQFAVPQNHNDFTRVFVENHHVYGLRSDKFIEGNGRLGLDAPQRKDPETMGVLTDKAVEWLRKLEGDDPFFLYFAPVAVHGLITPSEQTAGTTRAGPYGDFIRDLDISVGRILDTLDEMGAAEDTLVIFTSDNGGVVSTRANAQQEAMAAGLEINGILRGGKHSVWQGGFQVPFVARWPGKIQPGSESESMIGLIDIYATVADIVKEPIGAPFTAAPDSISFLPELTGSGKTQRENLILQSADGVYAIRQGDWKLVEGYPFEPPETRKNAARSDEYSQQLFNLKADPRETMDLSRDNAKRVTDLKKLLTQQRNQGFSRN